MSEGNCIMVIIKSSHACSLNTQSLHRAYGHEIFQERSVTDKEGRTAMGQAIAAKKTGKFTWKKSDQQNF